MITLNSCEICDIEDAVLNMEAYVVKSAYDKITNLNYKNHVILTELELGEILNYISELEETILNNATMPQNSSVVSKLKHLEF